MKVRMKSYLFLLLCFFLQAAWADSVKIPVYVTSFYNSQGPEIDVGKYSKSLKTNNREKLNQAVEKMLEKKISLTPEQMFVAAIRLYELGEKDKAVYWFYEAQYRAKLFTSALAEQGSIGSKGFELKHAYNSFQQLAGLEINGYAGCNPDKWLATLKEVSESNRASPDLESIFPKVNFVPRNKWDELNNKVSSGMGGLSNFIEKNKSTWKQQRAANKADEKYCH